jgi:glc operon protein GlcG
MKTIFWTLLLAGAAMADHAGFAAKKSLTLDGARRIIAAAETEARRNNAGGVIAVVDDGGNLMALARLDGTFSAGANVSIGKARTAALFKKPTKFFEDIVNKGRFTMTALPDFTPLQGGVPVIIDGQVIGAVGVSGANSAAQDEEVAMAGARAITEHTAPSAAVSFIEGNKVAAAFAKGMPLIEVGEYKIHASRREKDGLAEIHERDTDIVYVVDGTATLVTGGRALNAKSIGPEEIRGATIEGGERRLLKKGDVVVVPNGVPHLFIDVTAPFTYYVVKVRSTEGAS